jgi:hypothetical protein
MDILQQDKNQYPQTAKDDPRAASSMQGPLRRLLVQASGGRIQTSTHANTILMLTVLALSVMSVIVLAWGDVFSIPEVMTRLCDRRA